eukprot:241595_1
MVYMICIGTNKGHKDANIWLILRIRQRRVKWSCLGMQKGGYDARQGFMDGDCLLQHENRDGIVKQLVNSSKFKRFEAKKKKRCQGYVKRMYSFGFVNAYNDGEVNEKIGPIANLKHQSKNQIQNIILQSAEWRLRGFLATKQDTINAYLVKPVLCY